MPDKPSGAFSVALRVKLVTFGRWSKKKTSSEETKEDQTSQVLVNQAAPLSPP